MPQLHYERLYRGLPEYARLPPSAARRDDAVKHLRSLRPGGIWLHNALQRDRIAWMRAWISAVPCCDSDADTVDASSASSDSENFA